MEDKISFAELSAMFNAHGFVFYKYCRAKGVRIFTERHMGAIRKKDLCKRYADIAEYIPSIGYHPKAGKYKISVQDYLYVDRAKVRPASPEAELTFKLVLSKQKEIFKVIKYADKTRGLSRWDSLTRRWVSVHKPARFEKAAEFRKICAEYEII